MDQIQKEKKIKEFEEFFFHTPLRENGINWYDFKKGSRILEIGCHYGEITKYFRKLDCQLVSLEFDPKKYEATKQVVNGEPSIELEKGTLVEYIQSHKKITFDYIVIVTSMERLGDFVLESKKELAIEKFFSLADQILTDDGVILMAVDNPFGIRNFSGASTYGKNSYEILQGKVKNTGVFSKKEMVDLFQKLNIQYYKFYYPFPDDKLPSVIYTDDYLPSNNSNKLNYLMYYHPKDTIIFNEIDVIKEIAKEKKIDFFANSYLIEIAKKPENLCKVKFVSFNNFRKKENQLMTKIYDTYVKKVNIFEEGLEHIRKIEEYCHILKENGICMIDEVKEDVVYSQYQNLKNLNDVLSEYIIDGDLETALRMIDSWYQELLKKFSHFMIQIEPNKEEMIENETVFEKYSVTISMEKKKKLTFLRYGFFDFLFENIFVEIKDQQITNMLVYDQEWCENNLPIQFIFYRAIHNLFFYNPKIKNDLTLETLYQTYQITEYIPEFQELERKIQESLIDEKVVEQYQSTYSALTTIEGLMETLYYSQKECQEVREQYHQLIKKVEQTNEQWQQLVDKLDQKVVELEQKLKEKNTIIDNIKRLFKK